MFCLYTSFKSVFVQTLTFELSEELFYNLVQKYLKQFKNKTLYQSRCYKNSPFGSYDYNLFTIAHSFRKNILVYIPVRIQILQADKLHACFRLVTMLSERIKFILLVLYWLPSRRVT